ncbi:Cytochrome P450 monooxygenase FUM15 [Colletotrichum spinosum]|uniref:Cytochrome P450 monooxygenase FUM15 n=1 Tax=Colletotrichum spinosum TaxID=1347390 RepID=A0A4R8QK23_9PEZI|nr:Cytochrome P450 monooxygenase FUM15 [Colletotrichum spinosum]
MRHDFDTLHNHKHQLIQHYDAVFEPSVAKRIFLQINMLHPQKLVMKIPIKLNRFMIEGPGYLHDLCRSSVIRRRDQLESHDIKSDHLDDLLSVMIRSKELEEQETIDQMRTFLSVGHDTTASSGGWAMYLLCKNPSIKARLCAELDENGPYDVPDICRKLESLPLLNAICNETLRLYPALPITVREAACDTRILDTIVPKGTWVIMSPWAINRSRAIWGDRANDFRPDAWLTTEPGTGKVHVNNHGGASHAFSQISFLHGPRICIGEKFARAELRCLVAAMALHFDFELADPDEEKTHAGVFTARPNGGIILKLKRRHETDSHSGI